jgi:hypothetical protein
LTATPVNCAREDDVVFGIAPSPEGFAEFVLLTIAVKSGVMLLVTVVDAEVSNPATTAAGSGEEEVSVRIISMVEVGREVTIVVEVEAAAESVRTEDEAPEGTLEIVELEGTVKERRAAHVAIFSPCGMLVMFFQQEHKCSHVLTAVSCYWGAKISSFAVAIVEKAAGLYQMSAKSAA